jgi:hypothetical protein
MYSHYMLTNLTFLRNTAYVDTSQLLISTCRFKKLRQKHLFFTFSLICFFPVSKATEEALGTICRKAASVSVSIFLLHLE